MGYTYHQASPRQVSAPLLAGLRSTWALVGRSPALCLHTVRGAPQANHWRLVHVYARWHAVCVDSTSWFVQ
jgi:hypothetical protein